MQYKALIQYVESLDKGLSANSKEGRRARKLKERWNLSIGEWNTLKFLAGSLQVCFALALAWAARNLM